LLNQWKLSVIPGDAFGAPGFIRFSLAADIKFIKEGIERFEMALSRLQK
jgi:aspartate/methionine/tyrosine aminotransferase